MLTSLRIQNFRSIRDASVKLGQVNLFIGPNNSGKSNFLKGVELLCNAIQAYPDASPGKHSDYQSLLTRGVENDVLWHNRHIKFDIISSTAGAAYVAHRYLGPAQIASHQFVPTNQFVSSNNNVNLAISKLTPNALVALKQDTPNTLVYKPDPSKFLLISQIKSEVSIMSDGQNVLSAIFHLSQNYRHKYHDLERDFAACVGSLIRFATPLYRVEPNEFRLKFFDQNDVGYWAEEVSEGVLYFLALLCIVHQPDPPKLLLLEEPEKGIHPRRIREVMNFIFELARLRDIQIILTSHSPYVVDHFADIPECISVFDRENGETVIRNAGDIITETNAKLVAEGKEPIHYSDALGEHWVSGFLGGVPA